MLLAGTDVGVPLQVPGISLHEELERLVEAGLTPLEALRTATLNPARVLDMADSLGIGRGRQARRSGPARTPTPSRTSATRRRSAPSSPTAGSTAGPTSTGFWRGRNVESGLGTQN